jgi:hypothetical protein
MKWSDIHLRRQSTPGRYVQSLDMAKVAHHCKALALPARCTRCHHIADTWEDILDVSPNIDTLRIQVGSRGLIRRLRGKAVEKTLKVLDIYLRCQNVEEECELVEALGRFDGIERLMIRSLHGPEELAWDIQEDRVLPLPFARLDSLHTIMFDVEFLAGPLSHFLIRSELPSLRSLARSPNHADADLQSIFQGKHAQSLRSITYLPIQQPSMMVTCPPPVNLLIMHPNLLNLAWLFRSRLDRLYEIIEAGRGGLLAHPLKTLTLPKWQSARSGTNPRTPVTHSLILQGLLSRPMPNLVEVRIDDHKWLTPSLGVTALSAGDQGEIRGWAEKLKIIGVDLLAEDGSKMPEIDQVTNMGRMGITAVKKRRRSSVKAERAGLAMLVEQAERVDEDGG